MRRREFIGLIGAAAAWPAALGAQQRSRQPVIGVLLYSNPQDDPDAESFRRGIRGLGYVEGQNITVEYRYAQGRPERLPGLAAELVGLKPDIVFALGGDVAPFASKATQTIPIVYAMSADPVRLGLAKSLARPEGNATGVTFLSDELAAKRLEVLKETAPRISRVAFLWNPDHADNELNGVQRAAAIHNVELRTIEFRGAGDLDRAFSVAKQAGVDGVYVVSSRHTVANLRPIIEFAAQNRLPLAGGWGAWAQAGGLVSYGPNVGEMVRQAAGYVDKVLKGAKPGDLPVQQPTRFELLVNLKTARALDLTIPESFLLRADKVIE
jgi:putative tryptophan/tyrosine transport system substrate-binding protein